MEENLPQPQVPVSPDPVSPDPVSPVPPPPPKRFPLKWILIIVLVVIIFFSGAYLVIKSQSSKPTPVPISQTPAQTTPTPIPNETANWKTYESTRFGFSIKYPLEFLVNEEAAKNTVTVEKEYKSQVQAPGWPSFMYISLIPDEFKGKAGEIYIYDPEEARILLNMQMGETNQYRTYTRLADIIIDGTSAKVFENPVPPRGGEKRRLYFHKGSNTYMIGLTISSEDKSMTLETFNQILSTFKFTDQTSSEGKACDSRIKDLYFNNIELGVNDIVINGTKLKIGEKTRYIKNPYCTADYQLISINNEKAVINFEGGCEAENIKCVEKIQIFCGGIAGKVCLKGYKCQLEGSYPDAGGKCVRY